MLLNQLAFKCTPNVNCRETEKLRFWFKPLFDKIKGQYLDDYGYEPVSTLVQTFNNSSYSSYIRKKIANNNRCFPDILLEELNADALLNTIGVQKGKYFDSIVCFSNLN